MPKKREFRDCFVGLQGWMIEDLGLYGNELIIYSIINSVCQIPGMSYYGSKEYLGRFVGSTRTAIRVLNSLIEKGYIKKRVINGKKTEYISLVNKKNSFNHEDKTDDSSMTNCHTNYDKMSHLSMTNCHTNYDKMSHNIIKIDKEDIYKTDRQGMSGCLSQRNNYIPSLEEVTEYAKSKNLKIDPVKFYEKNQERGWVTKQGQPIKRWKSIMWSWSDHEDIPKPKADKNSFQQNTYDFDQLEKDLIKN